MPEENVAASFDFVYVDYFGTGNQRPRSREESWV